MYSKATINIASVRLLWPYIVELWTLSKVLPWLREYRFRRTADEDDLGIEVYTREDWAHNVKERWSKGKEGYTPDFFIFRHDGKWYLVNNFASYDSDTGAYSEKEYGPYLFLSDAVIQYFIKARLSDMRERLYERQYMAEDLRTHKGKVMSTAELDRLVSAAKMLASLPITDEDRAKISSFFTATLDIFPAAAKPADEVDIAPIDPNKEGLPPSYVHEEDGDIPSLHIPPAEETKVYYCTVCKEVPVDALNGWDTCNECASKLDF